MHFFLLLSLQLLGVTETPFPLEEPPPPAPDVTQDSRFLAEFFYMLLMLGLLIGLLFFGTYFLRRLTSTRMEALNTTSTIKILERRTLSQRSILYLVEIEEKQFMVVENPSALAALEVAPLGKNRYNDRT